jgi:RNA-directed DNA polymerase
MEKEMKELYIEGVATHDGPESCVVVREGGGEALTGVRAGQAIEPRNQESGVPTPLSRPEGNIAGGAMREPSADPARSENQGMYGISMRENREIPSPARPADHRAGRSGNAEAVRLR